MAQIYLQYLLQECLSGDTALKAPRPAVSKPINMVGEVLPTAIYSNPKPNGHVGRRHTTDTDSMKPILAGSGWISEYSVIRETGLTANHIEFR